MKDKLFTIIGKYALLLSIFHVLSFAFSRTAIDYAFGDYSMDGILIKLMPYFSSLLLNLVMAYIVGQEIRTYEVKTKYVILATIVYRPLGVFAFLLYLFLQDASKGNKEVSR